MMLDSMVKNTATAKRDLSLSANCFSANYSGATETISLIANPGPDLLRPRSPAIYVGHRFLPVDYREGAVVHQDIDGPIIRRAELCSFVTPKSLTINTLRRPGRDEAGEILVLANVAMPSGHLLRPVVGQDGKAYSLNIQRGLHHDAKVLMADNDCMLVRMEVGQFLCLLFPDGLVRKFIAKAGGNLVQEHMSLRQMAEVRVSDAKKRLDNLAKKPDHVLLDFKPVLSGVVDLFHRLRGDRHESARAVVRDFFLSGVDEEHLSLVHRKLTAVLHSVDPVMVNALTASPKVEDVPLKKTEKASDRAGQTVRRDALRAERNALSQGMKGSSVGGKQYGKKGK